MVPLLAVTVLPMPNLCFFPAGLSIWKEHCGFSSMVIITLALSNLNRELFLILLYCLFHNLPIQKKFSRPNIKTSPRSHFFSAYCPMSPLCYNYKGTKGNIFINENFQSFRHQMNALTAFIHKADLNTNVKKCHYIHDGSRFS